MRLLINMDNRTEVGHIDWEFIHDMQGIAPEMITPEVIFLTRDFLKKIPAKWNNIKEKLVKHVQPDNVVHLAISDIENMGNEFKVRGKFQNKKGEHLGFHKIVVYDKDKFENDYLGSVISNRDGIFTLSFGKKAFSDFGMEAEPDIFFKVFYWENGKFHLLGETMPAVFEKTETNKHILLEYGIITL